MRLVETQVKVVGAPEPVIHPSTKVDAMHRCGVAIDHTGKGRIDDKNNTYKQPVTDTDV